jgi:hypothetical protein
MTSRKNGAKNVSLSCERRRRMLTDTNGRRLELTHNVTQNNSCSPLADAWSHGKSHPARIARAMTDVPSHQRTAGAPHASHNEPPEPLVLHRGSGALSSTLPRRVPIAADVDRAIRRATSVFASGLP